MSLFQKRFQAEHGFQQLLHKPDGNHERKGPCRPQGKRRLWVEGGVLGRGQGSETLASDSNLRSGQSLGPD